VDEWKHLTSLGSTDAVGWPAGFLVLWESPGEEGTYLTGCFVIHGNQRWPRSCLLCPTLPALTELELVGFPEWEGHGGSAGRISGALGPCSEQFLTGGAFLGLRDQSDFARLFKRSWRLRVMNRASGKLKQLRFIAEEGLGSALPRSLLELP